MAVRQTAAKQRAALIQGLVWLVSGLWPVLHLRSFEWITGPKVDKWLVRTVGLLVTVVGAVLLGAHQRNRVTPEIQMLATGSALSLTAIDLFYVFKRRISPVYLLDAVLELGLIALWYIETPRAARDFTAPDELAPSTWVER